MKTLILKPNDGSVVEINGTTNFSSHGDKVFPWSLGVLSSLMKKRGDEVLFLDAMASDLSSTQVIERIRAFSPEIIIATVNPVSFRKSTSFNIGWDSELIYLINEPFEKWVMERAPHVRVFFGDWFSKVTGNNILSKDIPLPAYDLMPMHLYNHQQLLATDGCNHHCIFCHFGKLSERSWNSRSVSSIVEELKRLRSYGMRFIRIFDNELASDMYFAKELLRAIIREKLDIIWETNTRVSNLNEELVSLMSQAGCIYTGYGVECANQKVLDSNKKEITLEQIRTAARLFRKHNILARTYTLVGLKDANIQSVMETFEFLQNEIKSYNSTFDLVIPFPNTDYHRHLVETGKMHSEVQPSHITWIEKHIYKNTFLEKEESLKPEWNYDAISFEDACTLEHGLRTRIQMNTQWRKLNALVRRGPKGVRFLAAQTKYSRRLLRQLWN
ncbi:Fe-S oxidoreductase [Candidatus Scalindua japonica]|uniref:Fe-S oxidoreductase n=1 Tax=Candidatus Scalindua japonica TaxID=1284222 RepID=A0A286TWU2_9BACT|nr:radical SAM protein [Candidatus Scalindua japonica]GAX60359.1 Fe-S oxidoreductase [Candidatus Scalindua japonica]